MIRIFIILSHIIVIAGFSVATIHSINVSQYEKNSVPKDVDEHVVESWLSNDGAEAPLYLLRNRNTTAVAKLFLKNRLSALSPEEAHKNYAFLYPHFIRNISELRLSGNPIFVHVCALRL